MSDVVERRPAPGAWQASLPWRDLAHALAMAMASLLAYWAMDHGLSRIVGRDSDFLGGMWAAVAAIFVFRDTRQGSLSAGLARLIATGVSFGLCLPYFVLFRFTPGGMAALLALGTVIMMLLRRREDIITTGITTVVVMVVAAISPDTAWQQPLLRLADTVVGIAIGVSFRWIVYAGLGGKQAR
jgi:uncharacterized membrane protein YgaE (UPF0421/DUF939 family)